MLNQSALSARERAAISAALAADPSLAEEVEAIAAALRPVLRERFWRALAEESPHRQRPAAAVLAALERAALG